MSITFYMASLWLRQERICLQCQRPRFDSWVSKIPRRRKWHPTPIFLSGESHGQRSLADYSPLGLQRVKHDWATDTCFCLAFDFVMIHYKMLNKYWVAHCTCRRTWELGFKVSPNNQTTPQNWRDRRQPQSLHPHWAPEEIVASSAPETVFKTRTFDTKRQTSQFLLGVSKRQKHHI